MSTYYCLLGNTPQLSLLELTSILGNDHVKHVSAQVAEIEIPDTEVQSLMNRLGGVIKMCRSVKQLESSNPEAIQAEVVDFLASLGQPKVTFGVAEVGRDHHQPLDLAEIKNTLQEKGVSARYIESSRLGLSASVLSHHANVVEMMVLPATDAWQLCQTMAIQDIDSWTKRDRSKPYFDRRKGMLPPKVARMMVNIALGNLAQNGKSRSDVTLYDPFCGTGTVLMEAMVEGCQVVGSDLDEDSATGATKNLTWLATEEKFNTSFKVFMADATRVDPSQVGATVDAIVTEPFLGKVTPRAEQLAGIFKGLYKLYLGAFKQWQRILQPDGVVVIVFPYVQAGNRTFSLEALIDKLASLGYTIVSEPVLYHRPQAVVQRQIHVFRYKAK